MLSLTSMSVRTEFKNYCRNIIKNGGKLKNKKQDGGTLYGRVPEFKRKRFCFSFACLQLLIRI
jgi:hypothetical protein